MRLFLLFLFGSLGFARAQDASLADADLDFSRDIIVHYHFHARAEFKTPKGEIVRFEYDHYPLRGSYHGAERVKADEGTFARRAGGAWLKSDDWAQTGTPVPTSLVAELDTYVAIIDVIFERPQNLDLAQGKNVWKFIEKTGNNGITYYTYERSREHPHPNGSYPRYSFMKAAQDVDGRLFCVMATGQLRSGTDRVPYAIHFVYLVPIPPGTQVKVYDQVTKKEEYHTVTGNDSGWEITAQQSEPPSATATPSLDVHATVEDISPAQSAATNTPPVPSGN